MIEHAVEVRIDRPPAEIFADGDGTILRWSCEMAVSGAGRLFQPLIARSFKKACDRNFAQLKGLLEG